MLLLYSLKKKIYFNVFVFLAILFNIALHSIYGANESFIYSGNITFLYIIFIANSMTQIKKKKILNIILITFLFCIILNNFVWILDIKNNFLNTVIPNPSLIDMFTIK